MRTSSELDNLVGTTTAGELTWHPWPDEDTLIGNGGISAERHVPGGRLWAEIQDMGDRWSYELLRIATDDIEARDAVTLASGESFDLEWVLAELGRSVA